MSTHQASSDRTMQASGKLRWGRIVAGAFLLELALIILFVPMLMFLDISRIVPWVPLGTFGLGFLAGWWVARKISSRRTLHGTLAGVLATIIYVGLCMTNPGGIGPVVTMYGPFLFITGNALRIVGCAVGAYAYRSRG